MRWCGVRRRARRRRRGRGIGPMGEMLWERWRAWSDGAFAPMPFGLGEADRIFVVGSAGMMAAVGRAFAPGGALSGRVREDCARVVSVNAPMQCMMKGLCAQCLQRREDGSLAFACAGQDMPMDGVDFDFLHERLGLNGVQEKLDAAWGRAGWRGDAVGLAFAPPDT